MQFLFFFSVKFNVLFLIKFGHKFATELKVTSSHSLLVQLLVIIIFMVATNPKLKDTNYNGHVGGTI